MKMSNECIRPDMRCSRCGKPLESWEGRICFSMCDDCCEKDYEEFVEKNGGIYGYTKEELNLN